VLVCYLDDSGGDGDVPAITIGGYIAGLRAWEEFEPPARALLDRHEIEFLHGKRFHHGKRPFKGWPDAKKLEFVQELYALLRPLVLVGVGFSALKKELKQRNAETGLSLAGPPFPLADNPTTGGIFVICVNDILACRPGLFARTTTSLKFRSDLKRTPLPRCRGWRPWNTRSSGSRRSWCARWRPASRPSTAADSWHPCGRSAAG